jgi:hypothetical protein
MRRLKRLPSPALVVAGVALVAALGGSAIALPGKNVIDTNDIGKNDVRSGDINANVVDSSDIKQAIIKDEDLNAATLSPRAFALVTATANVTEANSRVVTDAMVSVQGSTYCFSGLPFTPTHVQATVEQTTASADVIVQATVNPPYDAAPCAGEQAALQLFDVSLAGLVTAPDFFVAFFD